MYNRIYNVFHVTRTPETTFKLYVSNEKLLDRKVVRFHGKQNMAYQLFASVEIFIFNLILLEHIFLSLEIEYWNIENRRTSRILVLNLMVYFTIICLGIY